MMLSRKERILAPMPTLINPFVELGKLEGRAEGECVMVLRLLERKFPPP